MSLVSLNHLQIVKIFMIIIYSPHVWGMPSASSILRLMEVWEYKMNMELTSENDKPRHQATPHASINRFTN